MGLHLQTLLESTDLQQSIVEAHRRALSHVLSHCNRLDSPATAPPHDADTLHVADCMSTVGTQLLEACGGHTSADLWCSTISTSIRKLLSSFSQLTVAQHDSSGSLDVHKPCVSEMSLAVAPVQGLCDTIERLLDRFPEQPMLEKLQTICRRILGATTVLHMHLCPVLLTAECDGDIRQQDLNDDKTAADFPLKTSEDALLIYF